MCGELPPPRVLARRCVRLAGDAGEHALVVRMPGPGSFTGEDVVELHVHAGARNVASVVNGVLAHGAEAAGPGEFSRRAFENGRLGLEQAEGIAALLAAQTDAALDQARRLVAGELGREVSRLASEIHALRSEIEANLDFPEDVADEDVARWQGELVETREILAGWLARFEAGRRSRERPRVVLAGPPNAGKSALFNALLGRSRAIVSPLPGTTRDYVEAELAIGRSELVLVDTAGLRDGAGVVEDAGILLSREQMDGADLVVWVEAADVVEVGAPHGEVLAVENKRDLGRRRAWLGATATADGVEELRGAIAEWLEQRVQQPWIGLARHRDRVREAMEALDEASALLVAAGPLEVVAFQLGVAERRLLEVTGRALLGPVGEDVLASIFSRFCIGK